MVQKIAAGFIVVIGLIATGCQVGLEKQGTTPAEFPGLNLPEVPYGYNMNAGNNYIPTLGRVLFYDTRLSGDNTVACASCHKQNLAFADNVAFSSGSQGSSTARNSMPIQNLNGLLSDRDTISLFWDGRETVLSKMVLDPILNPVEMNGVSLDAVVSRISQFPEYKLLFKLSYGDDAITAERLGTALSTFLLNINSNNSRLDKALLNTMQLTDLEQTGMVLFENKYDCNSCHQVTVPNGYQLGGLGAGDGANGGFINIGLEPDYKDIGRADFTHKQSDVGRFKIPTLRNVISTAPYMHDGRFKTLDEVMDHYSSGIAYHPNLDPRLMDSLTHEPKKMNIQPEERTAIIAFLGTLSDVSAQTDVKFSNPFLKNKE